MRLVLEVLSGIHRGKQIKVRAGETVRVGRARPAEVALVDNFLSGLHFALQCDANGCRLRDLNSRNGTQINGELVIEAPLKDGDQVYAGRTNFSVRLEVAKTSGSKSLSQSQSKSLSRRRSSKNLSTSKSSKSLSGSSKRSSSKSLSGSSKSLSGSSKRSSSKSLSGSSRSGSGAKRREAAVAPAPPVETPPLPATPIKTPLSPPLPVPTPPRPSTPAPAPRPPEVSAVALDSYEAATLEGRLFYLLSHQEQPLLALLDAVRDRGIIDLLQAHRDEHQSLYRSEQDPSIAPHLVRFAPQSALLKQMIQKGWGRQWGLYLTSSLSLADLRQYFRTALMVTMPDGMELFSRFYDPRFFRTFLESCTAAEAEPFFGPVGSYFMEDERPEILLEFTRSRSGAEKRGHLLSALS